MTYIKVSKSGYNALTDTNPQHFQFNSQYNTIKLSQVLSQLSLTVTNSGGNTLSGIGIASTSLTLPSNYSYVPYISCYIDMDGTVGYNSVSNAAGYGCITYYDPPSNSIILEYIYGNTGTNIATVSALPYIFANPI